MKRVTTLSLLSLSAAYVAMTQMGPSIASLYGFLLLLAVFAVVNVAVLVLRKDKVDHEHFRAPTWVPIVAGACTFYLVGPWTGRPLEQFQIALVLLAIGAVLGVITYFINRRIHRPTRIEHEEYLKSEGTRN